MEKPKPEHARMAGRRWPIPSPATVRRPDARAALAVAALTAAAAVVVVASAALAASVGLAGRGAETSGGQPVANPCIEQVPNGLLCPNLRIGPPADLYVEHAGGDRVLLRATSDVRSRGRGPMELRGRRNGPRSMRVNQRIYRAGGGYVDLPTRARLHFTDVGAYFGGSYWKVHDLASFELRRVGSHRRLGGVVRRGAKLNYCLRDLTRTRPGRRSPRSRHYPGCNQSRYTYSVTLGTSVGWSDIYPADYDRQWINVARLRGCFAFVMKVDPRNHLYESNEDDNTSQRLVRLPFRADTGC